jgi:hypothetical protein
LQVEAEFPLPPNELAWGYVESKIPAEEGSRQTTVVAVKKEILEDYADIFSACGINAVFTLAAVARGWPLAGNGGTCSWLDIGRRHSEMITIEQGRVTGLRILPWGGESITREISKQLGVGFEEAEKLKLEWDQETRAGGETSRGIEKAIHASLDNLADCLAGIVSGQKLWLSGKATSFKDLPGWLAKRTGTACEVFGSPAAKGSSAAIQGLQNFSRSNGGEPPLIIRWNGKGAAATNGTVNRTLVATWTSRSREILRQPSVRKWARFAAALAVLALLFPIIEPFAMKPVFAKRVAVIKTEKNRLGMIDRELSFLQFLKQNQPPYLDAITILACSVGPGSRFDSIAMNRRGDLSIKGSLKDSTQVSDFRSKLIKTGFFSSVTVEEQAPTPDRQKVNVRISAQVKPAPARAGISIDKILSNAPPVSPSGGGGFSGFGGPEMMFPPGMPMPPMEMRGPSTNKPPMRGPEGEKGPTLKMEKGRPIRTTNTGEGVSTSTVSETVILPSPPTSP